MGRIVGIDLGTSTSAVAAVRGGQAGILSLDDRERLMPTVIGLIGKGEVIVGQTARGQLETNPDFTFTGLKRLLGRRFDDPNVQAWAEMVSYEIVAGPKGEAWVRGPDRLYSPVELLSHVFKKLREIATSALSEEVTRCVIGAPAQFDVLQKEALKEAARLGGLEPVRLLSEPVAAAVANGVERTNNRTMAIYDFGGGTFDVTILKIVGQRFKTLATSGDPFLGGEDFDQRIVDWLVERFKEKHGVDLRDDPSAKNRVRLKAEKAKEDLSAQSSAPIYAAQIALAQDRTHMFSLDETLDRETFEELVADLVDRTRQPCRDVLKKAKIGVRDIDEVMRVGGMTRMPLVVHTMAEIFERAPSQRFDPVTAVALGCALQAAALSGDLKNFDLNETTPMPFQVQVGNGAFVPIIPANAQLPARNKRRFGLADPSKDAAAIRVFHGSRQVDTLVMNGLVRESEIDVEIDVDGDGVITTTATHLATKDKIAHRIHAESGMSEAQMHALKDVEFEAA